MLELLQVVSIDIKQVLTTLEVCNNKRKVDHTAPTHINNDKIASAQAGLQEASRQVKHS